MKKVILIICLIAGVLAVPFYLGYFDKPEAKVQEFTDAHNDQDVERMLEILDSAEIDQLKGTMKITGKISEALVGMDVTDILLDVFPLMKEFADMDGAPYMSVDVQEVKTNLSKNDAQVYGDVIYETEKEREEVKAVFYLHKKDRSWYISDFEETRKY